jgi:hypothetical protein
MRMTATRSRRDALVARGAALALVARERRRRLGRRRADGVGVGRLLGESSSRSTPGRAPTVRAGRWATSTGPATTTSSAGRATSSTGGADNNGGLDGDTRDTSYKVKVCGD